jgi:DNA-binding response OmpR family regulator
MSIALIEDEEKLAKTLKDGLESEGYMVRVFADGVTAAKECTTNGAAYSLVILDLILPGKDGFEVAKEIRTRGFLMPILVLTARDSIEDKVLALNSGADDFLAKPFSFEELLARVRAHIRRSQGFPGTNTKIGSLSINLHTREVRRDSTRIALTPTEFNLLALLTENPDRVLSREEISQQLWDITDGTMTNIVDVHISNLRKKIDDDYAQKVIRTVRGAGYAIQKQD